MLLLHLSSMFSLSFWLVAKSLCSVSFMMSSSLRRVKTREREGKCSRREGDAEVPQGNSYLWHSGTSQGYRDQAAGSQLWREGFPLSCCDCSGEWLVVIITVCSRADWCGDSTRLAWTPLPRLRTSLGLSTTSFSTRLTLQSPEKQVVQNFKGSRAELVD